MKRTQRRRDAFTLLELMIVLVILVLLFAMVGPRLLGSQRKADIKAAQTQIGNLEAALKLYAVDMRTFPSTEDGLQALIEPPSDERAARKWDGPYLDDEVLPLDPWDGAYEYEYPPSNNNRDFPDIWSVGPDGEADTDDDIINWKGGGDGEAGDGESFDEGGSRDSGPRPPSGGGGGGADMGGGGGRSPE
jgi:general secretion pathway protein G